MGKDGSLHLHFHYEDSIKLHKLQVSIVVIFTISSYKIFFIVCLHCYRISTRLLPDAINIPIDEWFDRLTEIPMDKDVYVYCAIGLSGYLAYRNMGSAWV